MSFSNSNSFLPTVSSSMFVLQSGFIQKVESNIQENSIIFSEKQHFSRTFPVATHPGNNNVREAAAGMQSIFHANVNRQKN